MAFFYKGKHFLNEAHYLRLSCISFKCWCIFIVQIEYNFRYLQCPLTLNKKLKDDEDISYEPLTTLNVSPLFYSDIIACSLDD